MPSRVFRVAVLGLVASAALLAWEPWAASSDQTTGSPSENPAELGYYPPAPSTAVGMTEEWRAFADQVDRICAVTYNDMVALLAQAEAVGEARGWSDARIEGARIHLMANQGAQILRATSKLGEPPERPDLFASWRENVARRASLKARASIAAADARWHQRSRLMNRVYRLKDRSDRIGQSFGLQICTSN